MTHSNFKQSDGETAPDHTMYPSLIYLDNFMNITTTKFTYIRLIVICVQVSSYAYVAYTNLFPYIYLYGRTCDA